MSSATALLALGILSSSFLGSWHCAGMCGPIATLMSNRGHLWLYHLGRLVSYSALGLAAGTLGSVFLKSDFITLRWVSAGVLALMLVFSGVNLIYPKFLLQNFSGHKIFNLLKKLKLFTVDSSGFVVGLLTAFLPCGWLYTYVLAAIATRSAYAGTLTLVLFWLGGMPTLSAVPLMIRKTVHAGGLKQQRIAGVILIASGLYSLMSFMFVH